MCGSFRSVCKMVTLGRIESLTQNLIHCKMITHQAVKIRWCTRTPKMHANDKNSTSPQEWKIFSWCQVRFVKNERLERKTSDTRVSLRHYSTFYRRHMYKTNYRLQYPKFFSYPAVMLEMTTKVVTYSRFFLIESIGYGFRSITSTVVLYSIQMYRFLHRSGGESNGKLKSRVQLHWQWKFRTI